MNRGRTGARRGERAPTMLGYGAVLMLVTASASIQMLVSNSTTARFAVIVLQAATLVAAVRASGARRAAVRAASLAAATGAVAALVIWVAHGDINVGLAAIVNGLLVAVAPGAIAAGLVRDLRGERRVTTSTLAGVLAIYLLAGMLFSFLYGVVELADAGSLFTTAAASTPADRLYFSYVTLSTVGYGDLSPAAHGARALAVAEMLIGQIYLVTVVALIVGNLGRGPTDTPRLKPEPPRAG